MILNIIFVICLYPILPVLYFVMRMNSKPKKNVLIGVTLPTEFLEDEEVTKLCNRFKKNLKKIMIIYAFIPIIFFFMSYMSIALTMWMLWMFGAIFGTSWPYIKYNKKLSLLKAEKQWKIKNGNKTVEDIRTEVENIKTINKPLFILTVVISCIPGVYELMQSPGTKHFLPNVILTVLIGFITLICFIVGILMDRQKAEVISLNSDINANFNKEKKRIWSKCWIDMAWINTAYTIAIWAFIENFFSSGMVFMLISMVYTILIMWICIRAGLNIRKIQQKIVGKELDQVLCDDDSNWIYGMIYYNPNDKHTMVGKRLGIGTTVNMATAAGKWFIGLAVLSILIIPVMCIWLMFEEFTPISLKFSNNQIVAEHLKVEYAINIDDITEIKLISQLPNANKIMGTGMDNLDKGSFSVNGYGDCDLCLNPQNKAFIIVKTVDNTYFLSDEDNAVTQKVYEEVEKNK